MIKKVKQRIEQLRNNLFMEPYRQWYCKDHNMYGSGGTNRRCCEEELEELIEKQNVNKIRNKKRGK